MENSGIMAKVKEVVEQMPKEAQTVEKISDNDFKLLRRLNTEKQVLEAKAIFITDHFAEVYKLNPGDSISDAGVIIRNAQMPVTGNGFNISASGNVEKLETSNAPASDPV